jgi:hypothetical protein
MMASSTMMPMMRYTRLRPLDVAGWTGGYGWLGWMMSGGWVG